MGQDTLKMKKDLIRWAKRRAEKYVLPCTITEDDFEMPEKCPVFGIKLEKGDGVSQDSSPTLDRIVPELGYVPGNVLVISNRANRVKANVTWHELRMLCAFYEEHITQQWMKGVKRHVGIH